MEEKRPIDPWWNQQTEDLQRREVIVCDISSFPVYQDEMAYPHLSVGLNLSGSARIRYDMNEVDFRPHDVAVVLPNHILYPIENTEDYHVKMLLLSFDFLKELKQRTLSHDYAKFHLDPCSHLTDEQANQLLRIYELIQTITEIDDLPNRHEMLIYLVDIALEFLNLYRKEQDKISKFNNNTSNEVFNRFCDLLAKHYCESHEVNFYAGKLCLSPKYFSRLVQKSVGVSAADWITEYVIVHAKQMLITRTDLNIQGVSITLGFPDQAAFSRYFHRATGTTPKEYRKQKGIGI